MKAPVRSKSIGTKVTEEEYAVLEACAADQKQSLSEWTREALLAGGNLPSVRLLDCGRSGHLLRPPRPLHMSLRKVIKTRSSFPTEEAALKLLYLAITKTAAQWETIQHWKQMLNYLGTYCGDRIREAGARP